MPTHTIKIGVDSSGTLFCYPDEQFADELDKAKWESEVPVDQWVVFFAKGAPVEPKTITSKNPRTVTVAKGAKGHRETASGQDPRPIKYCVAATVNGELKECDPKLIVNP